MSHNNYAVGQKSVCNALHWIVTRLSSQHIIPCPWWIKRPQNSESDELEAIVTVYKPSYSIPIGYYYRSCVAVMQSYYIVCIGYRVRQLFSYLLTKDEAKITIIGASRSKPHTYHSYEKILYLCMYVCMYVCMWRYVVHVLVTQLRMCKRVSMRAHKAGKDRQRSPRVNSKCSSPNHRYCVWPNKVQLWSSQGVFEADQPCR